MPKNRQQQLTRTLIIEMAKAHVEYAISDTFNKYHIQNIVPLAGLTEPVFVEALTRVELAHIILAQTILNFVEQERKKSS